MINLLKIICIEKHRNKIYPTKKKMKKYDKSHKNPIVWLTAYKKKNATRTSISFAVNRSFLFEAPTPAFAPLLFNLHAFVNNNATTRQLNTTIQLLNTAAWRMSIGCCCYINEHWTKKKTEFYIKTVGRKKRELFFNSSFSYWKTIFDLFCCFYFYIKKEKNFLQKKKTAVACMLKAFFDLLTDQKWI